MSLVTSLVSRCVVGVWLLLLVSCQTVRPLTFAPQTGDEMIVAGRRFHTGTRIVTWMDPGGYDAYRSERRFSPIEDSGWDKTKEMVKGVATPNRYGLRRDGLAADELERVRGGGWELAALQQRVDQFVLHYDEAGTSRQCFKILHDLRGLSVHFMLDVDGTIYQTLDLKERAWHATTSNSRSVGIEIANLGAKPRGLLKVLEEWYPRGEDGRPQFKMPARWGDPQFATPHFVGRPARPELVRGMVQGKEVFQYDLTPEQYAALIRLTAALCTVFPQITCDYPRDGHGKLVTVKLPDETLRNYRGLLGHFHVQENKIDPGPAFAWDAVLNGAQKMLGRPVRPAGQ
ncbi:MAG: hypothetical protein RL077_4216 [Verrucomicrobiota bacterium]